ncbi:hypothetical protein D3C81_1389440 [compost metagenome]
MCIKTLDAMASIAHADGVIVVGTDQFWLVAVCLQLCDVALQLLISRASKGLGQVFAILNSDDEAGPVFNRCHEAMLLSYGARSNDFGLYFLRSKRKFCH